MTRKNDKRLTKHKGKLQNKFGLLHLVTNPFVMFIYCYKQNMELTYYF